MMSVWCVLAYSLHTEGCLSWKASLAKLWYHELQFACIDDLYVQIAIQSPHSLS